MSPKRATANATVEAAVQAGRANRIKYGSGLDVLQASLKDGSQPDLIKRSLERKMIRIW